MRKILEETLMLSTLRKQRGLNSGMLNFGLVAVVEGKQWCKRSKVQKDYGVEAAVVGLNAGSQEKR